MSFFFRESGLDMPWSGPVLAVRLENEVKAIAQTGNLRIVGPNCLGIICPTSGLNASFANLMPQKGSVAFISQSGAMITSVLDWSVSQKVGFSAVISIGSMLDMDFSSMIFYLAKDPATKSIVLYMESIGNARSFLSAAREAALTKPIIVIKGGRTDAAAKAAASHTGSLTGSDAVLDAAFKRAGVLRVENMSDLFEMVTALHWPLCSSEDLVIGPLDFLRHKLLAMSQSRRPREHPARNVSE